MSDLAAAAAALGVPESLVKRSAEARAKASGTSVDQILAAWAGGAAAPEAAAAPAATVQPAEAAPALSTEVASPPPVPVSTAAPMVAAPVSAPRGPAGTPVLVGVRQGAGVLMSGSIGLLMLSLLLGFLVPSLPQAGNGVRSSNHAFSTQALIGRSIYLDQGCGSCHTQLIRDVVSDASLGPVSLADTNLVIGHRRIGPDLAAIGDRTDDRSALATLLTRGGRHPVVIGLNDQELSYLVAFLMESR